MLAECLDFTLVSLSQDTVDKHRRIGLLHYDGKGNPNSNNPSPSHHSDAALVHPQRLNELDEEDIPLDLLRY